MAHPALTLPKPPAPALRAVRVVGAADADEAFALDRETRRVLTAPRILALFGAAVVGVASLLPWYQYDVVFGSVGGAATRGGGAVGLWSIDPFAGALLVGAAVAAALVLCLTDVRGARHLAGALGLAITGYALLRWFGTPSLASIMGSTRRAAVVTGGASVDEGIFVMLLGGATLVLAAMESAASVREPGLSGAG
jgi:hypothetical protein